MGAEPRWRAQGLLRCDLLGVSFLLVSVQPPPSLRNSLSTDDMERRFFFGVSSFSPSTTWAEFKRA